MRSEPVDRLPVVDPATLDLFPDIVWVAGPDGSVVYVNRAFRSVTGYDGPVVSDIFAKVVHPDDFGRERTNWLACVESGKRYEGEVRLRGVDGRYEWYRSRGDRIAADSAAGGWIGVLTRITAERAARNRGALLAASNALFVALTDPDDVIDGLLTVLVPLYADYAIVDLFHDDGTFDCCIVGGPDEIKELALRTRQRYAASTGDMSGTAWDVARHGGTIVVGPAGLRPSMSGNARATNRELGVRSAIVVPLDDGRHRIGALSLGRIGDDYEPYSSEDVPFYVDLGARAASAIDHARTTRAMVESERVYRTLADQLPDLVGLTRPDGTVIYLNNASFAYTGRKFDERGGVGWQEDIHPDDLEQLSTRWRAALESGNPLEVQYRLRRYDGVYRWFLNRAVPIRDAGGEISAWIGVATDIDERKRAEDALRVAVEIGGIFAPTLDTSVALQLVADVAIDHLADWCGVYVLDADRKLQPVAIAHKDPARVRFVREYLRRYPSDESDAVYQVARNRVAQRINDIPPEAYDAISDPQRREMARGLGVRSIMMVPLAIEDQSYGVLSLALSETNRTFGDEDERLALLIAQRAAIAIGNARLFERQRDVARRLQATFLPSTFPKLDHAVFDAVYVPGSRDLTIGGDWYDVFAYDEETLAFSVGDVAGHGLEAAVPMGKVRQAFRALSVVERDPACLVSIADSVLRREHPDTFVTAFVATYDIRSARLRYTLAGHPSPFIRSPGGALRRLHAANVPLGLAELDDIETHEDVLRAGELVVAFSDGLIESDRDITAGEARVARALAHAAFEICSEPAQLLRALAVPLAVEDDVAILTVHITPGADWTFDANDGAAAQAARAQFVARLRADGLSEEQLMAGEMVFGEIVGNVARYTPGPVDLALRRDGARLLLVALDRGPGFGWTHAAPDAESESGRGLFLIEALAAERRYEHFPGFGSYLEVALAS